MKNFSRVAIDDSRCLYCLIFIQKYSKYYCLKQHEATTFNIKTYHEYSKKI